MDINLRKFISSRQERGESYFTHVSQIQPTGKYNINRRDIEDFWDLYCDTLYQNENMICGLAERPCDYSPVLNDTDIKIDYNPEIHSLDKKLYKETHLKQIVMIYQKHFKQIIKDYLPKYGICFVLEKEKPTLDDREQIRHGFHLHFIYNIMHKVDQDIHLIPRIKKEVDDKGLFSDLGIQVSSETIDKTCSKYWLLYGSRKKENLSYYKVSKIYDDNCDEITLAEALSEYKLMNIHGDEIVMDTTRLPYYLPRILSIDANNKEPVVLKSDLSILTKKQLKKAKESKAVCEDLPTPEAIKKAKELIKFVSAERTDNFDDWIRVGWILYNIGDGTEEALDLWIEFSARTTKKKYFSEKICVYEWSRMERRGMTIASLYQLVKQDSPEEYKKLQKKENEKIFNESLNGGHYDMAKWLYNKYRDEFVCACLEKNVWFKYRNHRWCVDKHGISLRKKISIELVNEYKNLKKKICEDMGEEDDDSEHQKRLKVVQKIIANLKTTPFKNNILKECQELFYDENFSEKLDADPYLMHFKNGILDLRELRMRPGRPSDYISLSVGYEFVEHTWEDLEVLECSDHLSKVFPDPILKQYFIEYCGNLLKGGNNIKTFLNMSGEGDNGKSINMDLLKLVLGKYMKILPTSLITGKRTQSSAATPELDGVQGVRFAVLQEPNSKDIINVGILKELSGNDVLYIRGLFKNSQEIRPMFKLALVCNDLPRLPCDDPAAWNRIRVLPHEACFPKDSTTVPENIEEQFRLKRFPRDPFFSEKLPKMKTAFMWMMFETYKRILREGRMPEPEKVREATAIYRKNNDVFLQFISEKIIEEPDNEKASISVIEVYNSFKSWFNDSYPNLHHSIPSKEDMKKELIRKWGELSKSHKWQGYRLRTLEDDERDGNVIVLRDNDFSRPTTETSKSNSTRQLLFENNNDDITNSDAPM